MADSVGSTKDSLQRYVRKHLDDSEYNGFFLEIVESKADALIALRIGALVEETLEQTLKASLAYSPADVLDQLFGPRGYLRDFAAKIVAAHAIGIFGEITYKNLGTIRAVRNAFAHSTRELTFQDARVHDLCKSLNLIGLLDEDPELVSIELGDVRYYVAGMGAVEVLRKEITRAGENLLRSSRGPKRSSLA